MNYSAILLFCRVVPCIYFKNFTISMRIYTDICIKGTFWKWVVSITLSCYTSNKNWNFMYPYDWGKILRNKLEFHKNTTRLLNKVKTNAYYAFFLIPLNTSSINTGYFTHPLHSPYHTAYSFRVTWIVL